jgi:hypothetical protein
MEKNTKITNTSGEKINCQTDNIMINTKTNNTKTNNTKTNNTKTNKIKLKIYNLQDTIRNTVVAIQRYKKYEILSSNDLKLAYENLKVCFKTLENADIFLNNSLLDKCIDCIQTVTKDLTAIFRLYGTMNILDVLYVCFGNEYINTIHSDDTVSTLFKSKFDILTKYFHPISYKIIPWKKDKTKDKTNETLTQKLILLKKIV